MHEDRRRPIDSVLWELARVAAAGEWQPREIERRWFQTLGRKKRLPWGAALAERLVEAYPVVPGFAEILGVLTQSAALVLWIRKRLSRDTLVLKPAGTPVMLPWLTGFRDWSLLEITTPGQLADWLQITVGELDWFADRWSWESRRATSRTQNYRYRWLIRPGRRPRPLESPKPRLKTIQRRILHEILDRVPVHRAAHGFRREHSISTYVQPHVHRDVVWKLDLRDFFCRIRRPRVSAVFRTLGYPEAVVSFLAGLVTNAAPACMIEEVAEKVSDHDRRLWRWLLMTPHLPQGAPTSPALANLIAYRLDARLAGLAQAARASYTRYADDLAFSGDREFGRSLPRFQVLALAIILDEGFAIRERKSREMWASQRQEIAGLVVNESPRVRRDDYDRLKATLHNCVRFGPGSQNRDGHSDFRTHLAGRIAYIGQFDPRRGERLRAMFAAIVWPHE